MRFRSATFRNQTEIDLQAVYGREEANCSALDAGEESAERTSENVAERHDERRECRVLGKAIEDSEVGDLNLLCG